MILGILLLFAGLTISAVAIYYSVLGLAAIFAAATIPIYVMGRSNTNRWHFNNCKKK